MYVRSMAVVTLQLFFTRYKTELLYPINHNIYSCLAATTNGPSLAHIFFSIPFVLDDGTFVNSLTFDYLGNLYYG